MTATEPTTEATSSVPSDGLTTVADPLAPTPAAEPTTVTTATASEPKTEAKPTRTRTTAVRSTATQRTVRPVAPEPASTAPAAAATTTPAPLAEPLAAAPASPMPAMIDEPAPAPVAPTAAGLDADDMLAAGAAGLGILALAGAGLAARRRRRRRVERDEWATETVHEPDAEPRFVRPEPVAVAPDASAMPAAAHGKFEAPVGSSPRTRAAYAGPSRDNPSLSLKKRLKRARALDQMERRHASPAARPVNHAEPARPAAQPAFAFRRASANAPAFQY